MYHDSSAAERVGIPLEIKKLGPEAEEVYLRALREGEQKIPYCGLLILGREQVGKTSLYRQLVGKEFKPDLESTKGIDNKTVNTVDRRVVDIERAEAWQEKEGTDIGEQFGDAVINTVVPDLHVKPEEPKEEVVVGVGLRELLKQIERIDNQLIELKRAAEAVRMALPPPAFQPPLPASVQSQHPSQPSRQQPRAPRPARIHREEEETTPQPEETPHRLIPSLPADAQEPQTPTQPARPPRQEVERSPPRQVSEDPAPPSEELPATPPPDEPPPERTESSGMLNRRQSSRIGNIVKGKQLFREKEPALVLNALDFAGQKEYRPMHHCFITRRAMYVVVFKIPDLLAADKKSDSIEEVRYWIHSIHAHIYPPDESMKGADEKVRRVFLVGTHRGEEKLSQEHFKEINNLIDDKLINDNRCVNHICPVELPEYGSAFFVPVENSLDMNKKGNCYLVESGTKPLQEKIRALSKDPKRLPFLHEPHPIKWLKFEEDLKDLSRSRRPPIVEIAEVKEIAVQCQISEEDMQDLALHFFHDTGKIICLSESIQVV